MVAEKAAAPAEVPAKVRGVSFWQSISAIPAILKYASYTAAGCGLIYTILSAIHEGDIWGGMDGAGVAVAGQVFWGLLWTVFSGAFLYGLSHLASKLLKEKESEP
jgi:hypothetical protein